MPVILNEVEVQQWLRLDDVVLGENMTLLKPFQDHGMDIVEL